MFYFCLPLISVITIDTCIVLQATLIVNNAHLHILPSLNPDGFSLRWRGNANNVDINRDFPDQVCFCVCHCKRFCFWNYGLLN